MGCRPGDAQSDRRRLTRRRQEQPVCVPLAFGGRHANKTGMSSSDDKNLRPATKVVQGGRRPEWTGDPRLGGGVVNPPVWRASTILYDNIADLKARGHATHDKL